MDVQFLTVIILTYLLFGSTFLTLYTRHHSRLMIAVALAWLLEATRVGILIAGGLDPTIDGAWYRICDLLYIPVTCLLAWGVLSFVKQRFPLWVGIGYVAFSTSIVLVYISPLLQSFVLEIGGLSVVPAFQDSFFLSVLLMVPGGLIRIALGVVLLLFFSKGHMEGSLVCALFFIFHGIGSVKSPFESILTNQISGLDVTWFIEVVGLSISVLILVLNREQVERRNAERDLEDSRQSIANLIRNLPGAAYRCKPDAGRTMLFISQGLRGMTGFRPRDLVTTGKRSYLDLIHPDDREQVSAAVHSAIEELEAFELIYRLQTSEDETRWVWENGIPVIGKDRNVIYLEGFISDITKLRETERALADANKELSETICKLEEKTIEISLLNEMAETLHICQNEDEIAEIVSRYCIQLFPTAAGGLYLNDISRENMTLASHWNKPHFEGDTIVPASCWAFRRAQVFIAEDHGDYNLCSHLQGKEIDFHVCVPLQAQANTSGILHLQWSSPQSPRKPDQTSVKQLATAVAEHITVALSNVRLRTLLKEQATRDPLTGLHNRRYLEDTLEKELARARRKETTLGLMVLDLDNFKTFNDRFGHSSGDRVLKRVGEHLARTVRAADVVCRFGGEEFVVLLPEISLTECLARAEELRSCVARIDLTDIAIPGASVTVSVGVASYPDIGFDGDSLFEAADQALYRAKHLGRDLVLKAERLRSVS
ncbi:MAG: diguanylate cyclase [Acidobacteriota bacterium]|nr:MAG: diguanylate cyclase [Acidobacteriota bacterium]